MEINAETATEQVRNAEVQLRTEFAEWLRGNHGQTWQDTELGDIADVCRRIREQERRERPGADDEPHLLGYAGLGHLRSLADRHWRCCVSPAGLWATASEKNLDLQKLERVRNPGAHGRTLFAHEYVEAEGIAACVPESLCSGARA